MKIINGGRFLQGLEIFVPKRLKVVRHDSLDDFAFRLSHALKFCKRFRFMSTATKEGNGEHEDYLH